MEHRNLMPFHQLRYKHIALLFLIITTIVSYKCADFNNERVTFAGITFILCSILLAAVTIIFFIDKWDDKIL